MPSFSTFEHIVDALELGVILIDQDFKVVFINDWVLQRSDIAEDNFDNKTITEVFSGLENSRLLECCYDALKSNLPSRLSNSFNPSPLPLYDPKNLGNDLYRLQQTITVQPLEIDNTPVCQLIIYDITTTVIKENWLKRIANNFRHQTQLKDQALEQLARIIENTGDAIIVFDKEGNIELTNASAKQLIGLSKKDPVKPTLRELLPVERDEHNSTLYDRLMLTLDRAEDANTSVKVPSITSHIRNKQGQLIPVDIRFSISHAKQDTKLITVVRDCSYQLETERNYQASETRFQTLAKIAPVGIFRTCDKGIVNYANETWLRLTSCTTAKLKQQHWLSFVADDFRQTAKNKWNSVRASTEGLKIEVKITGCPTCQDKTWVLCNLMAERDIFGNITGYVGTFTDITQQRANQEEIERLAFNDALTGLSNRRHFIDSLHRQFKSNRRTQQPFALMAMDLDGFKLINDSFGHDAGDMVLVKIAERLKHCLRESSLIGRIGGDEFSILIPQFDHLKELITIAQRIAATINIPIDIGAGEEVSVSSSIGIALYPGDADTAENLTKNADLALYAAKANQRDPFVFFNPNMNQRAEASRELERKLELALSEDQFTLYLQPVAMNDQHDHINAESLIRWTHPDQGLLQPELFINTLEKSRLASRFTRLSFEKICQLLQQLNAQGKKRNLKLSVNLSNNQVLADKFEETLISIVSQFDVPSKQIELEITEQSVSESFSAILPILTRLKQNGFTIILDDCNCNHLPIGKLSQLPLHALKIERSIIMDIEHNLAHQALVSGIVDIGDRLCWQVIGKGVETQQQKQVLEDCGCNSWQGFLLSRPMPTQEFVTFVADRESKVRSIKSHNTAF